EPNPNCLGYAQHLVDVNRFTDCTIVPVGLSDQSGLMKLFLNPDVDPSATLVEGFREAGRYARHVLGPVFVGDDVLDDLGVTEVAAIKIDVEGGELDVLRGLRRTLARSSPIVFCEVLPVFDAGTEMGAFRLKRQTEMLRALDSFGYAIFRVYVDDQIEEVSDFGGVHADMTLANYILVPRPRVDAFRRDFDVVPPARALASGGRPPWLRTITARPATC